MLLLIVTPLVSQFQQIIFRFGGYVNCLGQT